MDETLRMKILRLIIAREDKSSRLVNLFLIALIFANVLLTILDALGWYSTVEYPFLKDFFHFSVAVFTLEYVLRVWTCVDRESRRFRRPILGRLRYMFVYRTIIDLVAILPFYAGLLGYLEPDVVRILRLLWIFKLVRYQPRVLDYFLVTLICLNVVSVVLESVESIYSLYLPWFNALEFGSVIIFTVEYVLRVWGAVEKPNPRFHAPVRGRLRYMLTPMAIIDLLAVLPFYLPFIFPGFAALDLRVLRVFRLLRILKLTRYSSAMALLLTVLRQEIRTFGAALFILMFIALISGGIIYTLEQPYQPERFSSIPEALYWSIITLTTVGYGDITPVTPLGKVFGTIVAIAGIGMMALPAGILASAISDQIRRSRKEYESKVEQVLLRDGKISNAEMDELESTRTSLGLKQEEAGKILEHAAHSGRSMNACPHCGKPLAPNRRKLRGTRSSRDR